AADDEVGKDAPSSWLSIDPSVKGRLFWKDHRTLRMELSEDLDPKELYLAKLDLEAVTGQKGLPDYRFWFAPAPRNVDLTPQSFSKASDGSWNLSVRVAFSSQPSGDSSTWFAVSQAGGAPAIRWNPSGAQDGTGVLDITGIQRNGQLVELVVLAKKAGLPENEQIQFQIPSGDEPGVLYATPWNGENRMGFEVFFSDALPSIEEIQGFVKVGKSDRKLQLSVSGNLLRATFDPQYGEAQLFIGRGFPLQNGRRLAEGFSTTHAFKDLKPSLSWTERGIILPSQGENKIHFEAMNLGRVRVVVRRIRVENIPEHLADRTLEQMSSEYGRRQLGEEIWNRELQLGAKRNQVFAGTLDLGRILQLDAGLYSVSLEPVRQGMLYSCADQPQERKSRVIGEAQEAVEGDEESSEGSYGYSEDGEEYGYDGESYSYADRENPCKGSFWRYSHSGKVSRNLLVSDLGLMVTRDMDGRLNVATHDLLSAEPWSGVRIEALAVNDRVLASGATAGDGLFQMTGTSKASVIHAMAKKNGIEHHGWIRLDDGEARNLSKFDVGGEYSQEGIRIFLYGERGVWRPGDSIYLGAIVRGEDHKAIDRLPLKWILRDPRGKVVSTSVQRAAPDGHFGWRTATRSEDPTGRWSVTVEAGPASQTMGVQVETVRPNRLKIEIPATEVTADKDVELKSHWLSGGSAAGLNGKVEVAFLPKSFSPKGFEGYAFVNPTEPNGREEESVAWEGALDAAGSARFRINVPSDIGRNPMTVSLRTRVFEQGGQPSIDRVSLPYWPCVRYTGVRVRAEWGAVNQPLQVDLASVDRAGKALTGQNLRVEVYTNGKYWWWETGERFRSFLTRSSTRKVADLKGKSGSSVSFVPDSVGQYLVIVTDEATGHSAGTDVYVSTNGQPMAMDGEESSPARLRLAADKDTVAPGERVQISFPGAVDGRALVQLMKGRRVLVS
ncbi:MAG TPA: MG2 domain-containing protein, partial [Fibrobacteria bacterium]|nr:MG2 domain-containing protein [Fibrobacteria bacterium]